MDLTFHSQSLQRKSIYCLQKYDNLTKGARFNHEPFILLTPKQDVLYIYEDFTLRQTLEKWSNQRYATIPVLKRNGEYVGSITEGDILWGMKNLHGLDLEASEDVPISSFPRRRDYKAVTVTTDMRRFLKAAIEQNFVPVVDDRNVFIGMVRRTVLLRELYDKYTTLPTDKRFKGSHPPM